MTEEEAKTKWCFHFIASHTSPRQREWTEADAATQEPTGAFAYHCIGSECMAWRWKQQPYTETRAGTTAVFEVSIPHAGDGYCGLAGAPQ